MKLFPDDDFAQVVFAFLLGVAAVILSVGFFCWLTGTPFK